MHDFMHALTWVISICCKLHANSCILNRKEARRSLAVYRWKEGDAESNIGLSDCGRVHWVRVKYDVDKVSLLQLR